MPRKLSLTLACGDYEITRPLREGSVEPDGIDLTVLTRDRDRIIKSARRNECDIAEFNLIYYFMLKERGEPITALPIFPHRRFRHGFVFVNNQSGVRYATDLLGSKVGVRGYRPAAVVWIRGILQDHFDVPYDRVTWIDPRGLLGERPGIEDISAISDPGSTIDEMLLSGKVVAMVSPHFPPPFLNHDPRVTRLFDNYEDLEVEYFEKTGIFPIMHALTIRQEIVDRHPWVCASLAEAFERSKRVAYERIRNPRVLPLAFFHHAWERQQMLMGADPWMYGLNTVNRRNLETALRYAREQGLISTTPALGELFIDLDEGAFLGGLSGF